MHAENRPISEKWATQERWAARDRAMLIIGWSVWAVTALVVCVLVVRALHGPHPEQNTVTPNFRTAAAAWRAGQEMYTDPENGFLYLPQSAILYVPFTWGPVEVGEVAWRLVCIAAFATGLWRMVRVVLGGGREENQPQMNPDGPRRAGADSSSSGSIWVHLWLLLKDLSARPGSAFLLATLLCLPLAESNARNGQFNLPMAGLMLHAAADLGGGARGRWWRAALAMCLMTALKPLGLVMVLLAAVVYPKTAWRLAVGLAAVAALPFIHPNHAYVIGEYRTSLATMASAGKVEMPRGQDLRGLFAALHVAVAPVVLTAVRLAAAPLMLGIAWLGKRRWGEPKGAVMLLTAAAIYLTLFNPRCEGLTYVVLSPALALLLLRPPVCLRGTRSLLLGLGVAVAISQTLTGGVNTWMRPAAAIVLLGFVIALLMRPTVVETQAAAA